jgi:hypothetical protein
MNIIQRFKLSRRLPSWAVLNSTDGFVEVEPQLFYPTMLEALQIEEPTQYWLEVARRCGTEYLLEVLGLKQLKLRIRKNPKWKLTNFEPGDGALAGASAFRKYYGGVKNKLNA